MPTNKKPMSGRGQDEYSAKLDAYNKASRTSATGKFMRTFSRSKTSQLVTAWDDIDHAIIMNNTVNCIADATTAVDSATVPSAALLAILDAAWELYYKNANLKDLVAADETSWKSYFGAYLQISLALQIQYNFRCYLPAYTESDTVPGGYNSIPYFTQSSFDIFVASMKEYPAPKGVAELVNLIATWVIQIQPAYERYTVRIPPMIVFPFNDLYDLADLEGARECLRLNLGGFTTHARKYGLGTGGFKEPVKPTVKTLNDVDVIAFFNHLHFIFYDNQPATQDINPDGGYGGTNLTTEYTGTEYMFKDSPNESVFHVLAPWFGIYNATNNPYGGIFTRVAVNAAEYKINCLRVAQHGTTVDDMSISDKSCVAVIGLSKAWNDCNSAVWAITVGGTNFTASQAIDEAWPMAIFNNLYFGLGRGATETNNDILNYIGKLL